MLFCNLIIFRGKVILILSMMFYDEVQFTVRDWRNRNKILIDGKPHWLTVPVGADRNRKIVDVCMTDASWQKKHFDTLRRAYRKAPFWSQYEPFFRYVYLEKQWKYLYELNRFIVEHISREFLRIATTFSDSRDYLTHGAKHEKLLSLVQAAGANVYVSGPAAKNYIVAQDYEKAGIALIWKEYAGYPEYSQISDIFTHQVSVLDLLFNVGEDAPKYIWGWRGQATRGKRQ